MFTNIKDRWGDAIEDTSDARSMSAVILAIVSVIGLIVGVGFLVVWQPWAGSPIAAYILWRWIKWIFKIGSHK